jgi:mannose-6-phosphate isomerase-like protein (cupin superfamily)
MAEELRLTPHETVTIRESSPELIEVEATWTPGGKPPPGHYHPAQDEHFEVLEGTLTARIEGEDQDLGAGETLDIPRGTGHKIWNRSDAPARAIWRTNPRLRTEDWFRSVDRLSRGVRKEGTSPGLLAFGAYLSEYKDVFRLSGPEFIGRPMVAVLGVLGRAKGYRP